MDVKSCFVALLLFGIVFILGSCQSLVPIPQAEYSNELLGLSFQYPAEFWEILQEDDVQVVLRRLSDDGQDAIVAISVYSTDQLGANGPRDYLTTFTQGRQTECQGKQIIEKPHPLYEAATTCVDFTIQPANIPAGPFTIPSEITVLMNPSRTAQVIYVHFETSAEIHQKEIDDIISSIVLH